MYTELATETIENTVMEEAHPLLDMHTAWQPVAMSVVAQNQAAEIPAAHFPSTLNTSKLNTLSNSQLSDLNAEYTVAAYAKFRGRPEEAFIAAGSLVTESIGIEQDLQITDVEGRAYTATSESGYINIHFDPFGTEGRVTGTERQTMLLLMSDAMKLHEKTHHLPEEAVIVAPYTDEHMGKIAQRMGFVPFGQEGQLAFDHSYANGEAIVSAPKLSEAELHNDSKKYLVTTVSDLRDRLESMSALFKRGSRLTTQVRNGRIQSISKLSSLLEVAQRSTKYTLA